MATKITLKQLSKEILDLLNRTGDASLERDIISNVAVGAAPANTLFPQNQTFTEFAEKILRKDITPTLNASFSGAGLKEIGTAVNGTTIVASIANESQVTVPINEIKFYMGSTLLDTKPYVKGNNYTYVYNQPITTNTQFKVELTYNNNTKINKTGDFTFVYATYYGATDTSTMNDSIATSLATTFNKSIQNKKGLTWDNITLNDEKFCIMYPATFGALTSIKDGNNFEQINGYTKYMVNLTSPMNGKVVQYLVYLLTDATTGSGFKQIYS